MLRANGLPDDVSSCELHWIAGLLEGEGAFHPGPPTAPRYPVVSLEMIDRDVVGRVAAMFGRKPCCSKPREAHWRATHQVRIRGAKAVAWMQALHPLMGERRRAQIDRALASYDPNPVAILSDETAAQALAMLAAGGSVREVAERFGTTVWCMYDLRSGRTHKHLRRPVLGA